MAKYNYCTLFSSEYAARGLVMIDSINACCSDFCLYVIAFDDIMYHYLKKHHIPNVVPISMKEFESEEMLRVKKTRTLQEYCWTCEPLSIQYCLTHFNIPNCTYLDADLYFYANPNILVDEMGDDDVLLTEHRYTPDVVPYAGRFCVQFLTIKNTPNGNAILNWWCDRCIEWCFARHENGQYGDQVYLDVFPENFTGVHILQNLGGGVAPWNMQQYDFYKENDTYMIRELSTGKTCPVIFFHFHAIFNHYKGPIVEFSFINYPNPPHIVALLLKPYIQKLIRKYRTLPLPNTLNLTAREPIIWKTFIHRIMRRYKKVDEPYVYILRRLLYRSK